MAHGDKSSAPRQVGRPEKRSARLGTFVSLRNPDYRYLWIGNLFNTSAQWIQQITIGWLVWELSHSPLLVGLVSGVQALPVLVIGPMGGVAADRLDRRLLLMTTQAVMAVVAGLFAIVVAMGWVQVWHAMLFASITGCGFALNQPVRQALIANTVPRSDLGNAIALNSIGSNITRVIGPAVGGILIVTFGAAGNFLIQAGLFLGIVAIIFPMKVRYREAILSKNTSAVQNLREGLIYMWSDRTLFGLMMLSFVSHFFVVPLIQILPVFTDEVLHSNANVYGYLVAAYGVGGLLATLALASFGSAVRSGRLGIAALVASCAAAMLFALSSLVPLSLLLLAAMGFFLQTFGVNNHTLVQTMARDELRGRVMSIYSLNDPFKLLAIFLLAAFAGLFSAPSAVAVSGMLGLAVTVGLMLGIRQMRDLRHLRA